MDVDNVGVKDVDGLLSVDVSFGFYVWGYCFVGIG